MGRLQINSKAKSDWLLPKPALCILFWSGIILLFTGIVLLVLGNQRGKSFTEAGGIFVGLGMTLLLICLIVVLYARCVITTEDEDKNRVPWIRPYWNPPQIVYSVDEEEGKAFPYDEDSFKPIVHRDSGYTTLASGDNQANGTGHAGPNGTVPAHNGGQSLTVQRSKSGSPNGVQPHRGGSTSPNGIVVQGGRSTSPQVLSSSRGDSASPHSQSTSDNAFRSRSNSTGSKTVNFRNPVVSAVHHDSKEKVVPAHVEDSVYTSDRPPSGRKSNTPTEEVDRAWTPPFPQYDLAGSGALSTSTYGLPYNPGFPDPHIHGAISEYDLWEPDLGALESSHAVAYADVPMRKGGAGREFRDDMRRFSNPVKVYIRGQNFGLSQVSMYDNVRYLRDVDDDDEEEE